MEINVTDADVDVGDATTRLLLTNSDLQPVYAVLFSCKYSMIRGTQRQFSENICSEDDLRSIIFGTFVVKFLACLPLLGFSNI